MAGPITPTLERALALATEAHAGQVDKAGRPYIEHVQRVAHRVQVYLDGIPGPAITPACRENIVTAALLHDVVEDTSRTLDDLRALGFGEAVLRRVARLSGRTDGIGYLDNIRALAAEGDVGTMLVKLADNEDNADPERVALLPEEGRRGARKYEDSAAILRAGLDARGVRLGAARAASVRRQP